MNFPNLHLPLSFTFYLACLLTAASPVNGGNTALVVSGAPQEPISHGNSYYYTPANGTFTFSEEPGNVLRVVFQGPTIQERWDLTFYPPNGQPLSVGTYENTVAVDGFLTSCSGAQGPFTVKELVRELDGVLVSFDIAFKQTCTFSPPLTGEILYNSASPLPPRTRITSDSPPLFATKGQPFKFQVTSSAQLPVYSTTGLPAGLLINLSTGEIFGTPTVEGEFPASITVIDSSDGTSASGNLTITVDPASHSTGPYTAISLLGDPGNSVTSGLDVYIGPNDASFIGGTNGPSSAGVNSSTGYGVFLYAGQNQTLVPGVYIGSNPPAFGDPLAAVSSPRWPAIPFGSRGSFELFDFEQGSPGSFHANIEYHVNNENPAVRGTVWFRASNAITSLPQVRVTAGSAFTYQIVANNEPNSFGAANLPPDLALDPATGVISGTPTVTGKYMVDVSAFGETTTARDKISIFVIPGALAPPPGPPVISISVNTNQVHEGGVARLTVTTSAASGFNLTPRFQVTRKKASPNDFSMAPASFVIPAGQTTASVDLHASVDALTEKSESVTVKLVKGPGYKVGPNNKVTVTILDGP